MKCLLFVGIRLVATCLRIRPVWIIVYLIRREIGSEEPKPLFESRRKYLYLFSSPSICFEVRLMREVAESIF